MSMHPAYAIVAAIPKGKVLTYGDVARLSGLKSPRLVGSLLHRNPDPQYIPCHRVVNARGEVAAKFAFGGSTAQLQMLQKEGVPFRGSTVVLAKARWHGDTTRHI